MGQVPEFRKHVFNSRLLGWRFCLSLYPFDNVDTTLALTAGAIVIHADATPCTDVAFDVSNVHGRQIGGGNDRASVSCHKIIMT